MKFEEQQDPSEQEGMSKEQFEQLQEESKTCYDTLNIDVENKSRSYQHIVGNLSMGVKLILDISFENMPSELYPLVTDALSSLKKYSKLLEDFPEFKEKETSGEGYSPDMVQKFGNPEELVDFYEKTLRSES